ncbi:MAG: GntR family transcriptional regulator [Proteobacteria bacterium]|nr:GntR family transcriptional regulator [Pseudomonadota bacterium]
MTRRNKPRYSELGDELQAAIENGDYPVGSLLPTELELCERYGISRHTARAALARLTNAGLVRRRPGAGTQVIAARRAMRSEHEVDSLELLLQYGNSTRLKVLSARERDADTAVAGMLEIKKGETYLLLSAVRTEPSTPEPIAVTEMLVPIWPDTPVEKLLDRRTAPGTIARLLPPSALSQVEQIFEATSLSPRDAKLLRVDAADPAMRAHRRYRDAAGRLLMLAISLHPAGRFAYRVVLSRDALG